MSVRLVQFTDLHWYADPAGEYRGMATRASFEANTSTFKQFVENWQNTLNSSGMEHMKAYGEMMKKFTDTWNNMWPKLK